MMRTARRHSDAGGAITCVTGCCPSISGMCSQNSEVRRVFTVFNTYCSIPCSYTDYRYRTETRADANGRMGYFLRFESFDFCFGVFLVRVARGKKLALQCYGRCPELLRQVNFDPTRIFDPQTKQRRNTEHSGGFCFLGRLIS
jgi:hypothetical protein